MLKRRLSTAALVALIVSSAATQAQATDAAPINAKVGECYARVVSAPVFAGRTEQQLAKVASERIEIIPARFEMAEERVLVKPAGKKIVEIIPASYETIEEPVLLKPASETVDEVPAVFKIEEDTQLVKPATTMWKKGNGPIEKIDGLTGEIMCLVSVPAEYRTVKRKVLVSPAQTRRIPVPAVYGTVQRQVLLKPAEVREVETPAEYKTIRTQLLVTPPEEKRIPVPAEYQTVTSQVLVSEGKAEWKSILCQTNTTPAVVQEIQRALAARNFYRGKITGTINRETSAAITAFQQANGLATGGLTIETVEKLEVSVNKG